MSTAQKNVVALSGAMLVATVGLVLTGVALAWVAGSFGLSVAAASQIVAAVEAGGLALALVGAILGAGIAGAVIASVRWYLVKKGRALAIA